MPLPRALKWTLVLGGIVVGSVFTLLLVTILVAGTTAVVYHDEIVEAIPRPLYGYSQQWPTTSPHTEVRSDSFQVGSDVKEFKLFAEVVPETGCASIQLTSPSGKVLDLNGNGCERTEKTGTYTEQGTWQVRYAFAAFTGAVDVDVFAFERA